MCVISSLSRSLTHPRKSSPYVILSCCRPQGFAEAGGMLRPTEHVILLCHNLMSFTYVIPFCCRPQGFGEAGGMLRPTEHVPDKTGVIPPNAVSLFPYYTCLSHCLGFRVYTPNTVWFASGMLNCWMDCRKKMERPVGDALKQNFTGTFTI